MAEHATIHIDGAARGNPGPAAFAYVVQRDGHPVVEHSEAMGRATNNVAEYTALIRALEKAAELGLRRLEVFSDSEATPFFTRVQVRWAPGAILPLCPRSVYMSLARCSSHSAGGSTARSNSVTWFGNASSRMAATMSSR